MVDWVYNTKLLTYLLNSSLAVSEYTPLNTSGTAYIWHENCPSKIAKTITKRGVGGEGRWGGGGGGGRGSDEGERGRG